MPRRFIEDGPNGPVLVESPDDIGNIVVVGSTDKVELDVSEAEWADMHKQLKTGALDFATVKGKHNGNHSE